jgi:hypothetical protein
LQRPQRQAADGVGAVAGEAAAAVARQRRMRRARRLPAAVAEEDGEVAVAVVVAAPRQARA